MPLVKMPSRVIDAAASIEDQAQALRFLVETPPGNSRKVTVTPLLAAYILDPAHKFWMRNRTLKPNKLKRYAAAMKGGQWLYTGETIKFGRTGLLLDGYHRLTSCVRSSSSFEACIIFGIDDASFHAMDTGAVRGASDVLAIAGFTNSNLRAAATRWSMIFASGRPSDRSLQPTNEEIHEEHKKLNADGRFELAIAQCRALYRKSKHFTCGPMTALLYMYGSRRPDVAARFVEDALAEKGDAERFRMRLTEIGVANIGRVHENSRNARAIMTLNAYWTGKKLPRARNSPFWDSDSVFPAFPFDVSERPLASLEDEDEE